MQQERFLLWKKGLEVVDLAVGRDVLHQFGYRLGG